MNSQTQIGTTHIPHQLLIGLILIAIAWPLNWLLPGLRTHILFFVLWLGYALTVDGLVYLRKQTSLLTRSRSQFIGLFIASIPSWWTFEFLNDNFTHNWQYVGREHFTALSHFLFGTLCFSTVMPAVFGTAELIGSLGWVKRLGCGPIIKPTHVVTIGFFVAGWAMLALLIAWPRYFFPFVWLSVYFIVEPINVWLGNPSLADDTATGDWRRIVALWLGTLITGFFWEMWNYHSYPRWQYVLPPFVDFLRIYAMPLPGYTGYLPFGMELFALYQLLAHLLTRNTGSYIQIIDE